MSGQVRYKIDVYAKGVFATTGSIDVTLQSSRLVNGAPSFGGFLARPTQGSVESQPWSFNVLDVNSTFTGRLRDSSGRFQYMGRLVRASRSLNSTSSSAYKSVTVGRISDVILGKDISSYEVRVSDERVLERNTMVFAHLDDSVSVIPGGLTPPKGFAGIWAVRRVFGNLVALQLTTVRLVYSNQVASFIRQDMKSVNVVWSLVSPSGITSGFFKNLRWRNVSNSNDYEVGYLGNVQLPIVQYNPPLTPTDGLFNFSDTNNSSFIIWVVWTASVPSVGTLVPGFVHAKGAIPTDAVPLNVGPFHPGELTRKVLNGDYSTSGPVRYSTAAIATWKADPQYGQVWYRATGPELMSDFLEKKMYQAYGMIPAIDSSGKVAPVSVLTPTTIAPIALTSTNLTQPHPTWQAMGREVVNAVTVRIAQYNAQTNPRPFAADLVTPTTWIFSTQYTNTYKGSVASVGRRELALTFGSIFAPGTLYPTNSSGPQYYTPSPDSMVAHLQRRWFDRFGDGPIYVDAQCLASVDNTTLGPIKAGSWVSMTLATLPGVGARGTSRYMQVMRREDTVIGPKLTLLDLGAAVGGLAAPSLGTFALSSQSSRFGIKAVVSGSTAGALHDIRLGIGTSAAAPASNSSKWKMVVSGGSTSATTHQIGALASNSWWWGQVRQTKAGRLMSPWSTGAKKQLTAKIGGPTSCVASSISAGRAKLKWKLGTASSIFPTEVMLTDSTGQTLGTSLSVTRTIPATTQYQLGGLTTGANHKAGVRHCDPFGGFSTIAQTVFTASGSRTAPPPKGIIIVAGKP